MPKLRICQCSYVYKAYRCSSPSDTNAQLSWTRGTQTKTATLNHHIQIPFVPYFLLFPYQSRICFYNLILLAYSSAIYKVSGKLQSRPAIISGNPVLYRGFGYMDELHSSNIVSPICLPYSESNEYRSLLHQHMWLVIPWDVLPKVIVASAPCTHAQFDLYAIEHSGKM